MFNVFVIMANRLPRETELFVKGIWAAMGQTLFVFVKKSLSVLGVTEDGHFCFL